MHLSQYFQDVIADWIRGVAAPTAPASIFIGLSTADPEADGSGINEPSGANGYARQAITFSAVETDTTGSSIYSNAVITFGPVTNATWDDVGYVFLHDGTNLIAYGEMTTVRSMPVGDTLALDLRAIQLKLSNAFATYAAAAFLSWVRGTAMPAAPTTLKLALSSTNPKADLTGLVEPSTANGYQRQTIVFDDPVFVPNDGTVLALDAPVIFGPAVLNPWGSIAHGAILDQAGHGIAYGAFASPRNIVVSDSLSIPTQVIKLLVR